MYIPFIENSLLYASITFAEQSQNFDTAEYSLNVCSLELCIKYTLKTPLEYVKALKDKLSNLTDLSSCPGVLKTSGGEHSMQPHGKHGEYTE